MPGFAPGTFAQELHELDHDAVGVLATEHFDPAASQTHACGRAVGEVTGGGKSGIDAVTIAGLEADASDCRLGKISAGAPAPALAASTRSGRDGSSRCRPTAQEGRHGHHNRREGRETGPKPACPKVRIGPEVSSKSKVFLKAYKLIESERLREVRAVNIDVEKPLDVFRNHQS